MGRCGRAAPAKGQDLALAAKRTDGTRAGCKFAYVTQDKKGSKEDASRIRREKLVAGATYRQPD